MLSNRWGHTQSIHSDCPCMSSMSYFFRPLASYMHKAVVKRKLPIHHPVIMYSTLQDCNLLPYYYKPTMLSVIIIMEVQFERRVITTLSNFKVVNVTVTRTHLSQLYGTAYLKLVTCSLNHDQIKLNISEFKVMMWTTNTTWAREGDQYKGCSNVFFSRMISEGYKLYA